MRILPASITLVLLAVLTACGDGPPSSLFNAGGYHVRGDKVYFLRAFPGDATEMKQADAKTFEILDRDYVAKDKGAVYVDGVVLADADPATFALMDRENYAKDATHVFLRDRVLSTDVAHFGFYEDSDLAHDSEHVYWTDGSVLSDDPEHFAVLPDGEDYLFTKDRTTVWVNGAVITGADPATFEVVGGAYGEDGGTVYYFTDPVQGVDVATLELLDGPYARDEDSVFWMGTEIPGADPATFEILNVDFECAADADHGFYRDAEIADFDPASLPAGAHVNNCTETFVGYS